MTSLYRYFLDSTNSISSRLFKFALAAAEISVVVVLALNSAQAATIVVPSGGDLMAAISAAQPGDTIVLQAGATYMGPFTLPNKAGAAYITIQSSRVSELSDGLRVSPAQAALFPKLVSRGLGDPVIKTATAAHHYKFVGIEFAPQDANAAFPMRPTFLPIMTLVKLPQA